MNTPTMQYQTFAPFLTQLRGAGLELPDQVTGAVAILEDSAGLSQEVLAGPVVDPLCSDRAQWVDLIRRSAVTAVTQERLGPIMWGVLDQITAAVAQALRENADGLIDQLRPRFDAAAKVVHAATKVGIESGTTPADVITFGPKAVAAWRDLPEHVAVLDEVATVRIAMTDLLDVAPLDGTFEPRRYAAAFNSRAVWETGHPRYRYGDYHLHRWLRLSAQAEPLRLLTLAETHRLDLAARAPVRPTVPDEEDSEFRVTEVVYR